MIMPEPIKVFYCYAHEDKKFRDRLGQHLEPLRQSGKIVSWHDQEISPGQEYESEIIAHIDAADIILALISPAFISSAYCQNVEIRRALEKHVIGKSRIIPVILKDVEWKNTPLGGIQALPTTAKPLVAWSPIDRGYRDVVLGVQKVIEEITNDKPFKNEKEYRAHIDKARALWMNQFYEYAVPALKKALHYDENDILTWMGLVESLQALDRHKELLSVCDRVFHLYSLNRNAIFAMENTLEAAREVEDYVFVFQMKYDLLMKQGPSIELNQVEEDLQSMKNDMAALYEKGYH